MRKLFTRNIKKVVSLFALFSLLFQNVAPVAILGMQVYAQEQAVGEVTNIDPKNVSLDFNQDSHEFKLAVNSNEDLEYLMVYEDAEKTDESGAQKAITGLAAAQEGVAEATFYAGTCSNQDCLPDEVKEGSLQLVGTDYQADFKIENDQTWLIKDKLAVVSDVQVGQTYVAPQNSEVEVTFSELPENPGNLYIEEVELSDEQVAALGAYSKVAYDISSDMENGSFKFDLKLPLPEGADDQAKVKFAEKVEDLEQAQEVQAETIAVDQTQKKVAVAGLDHMTVFVVSNPVLTGQSCVDAEGGADGCYQTIQAAIDAVDDTDSDPDEIIIKPGIYTENIVLNKNVDLIGSGNGTDPNVDTIIRQNANVHLVEFSASGVSESDRILLKNIRIEPVNEYGIKIKDFATVSHIEFDGLKIVGTNQNNDTETESGLYVPTTSSIDDLVIKNSAFDHLTYGWYLAKDGNWGPGQSTVTNISVINTSFDWNDAKGLYIEKLSDAVFENISVSNNGQNPSFWNSPWNTGMDINLKGEEGYKNITIKNSTFENNAHSVKEGAAITIKARDDAPSYSAHPATLDGVTLTGNTVTGNERGIRFGEPGKNNYGPTNVVVNYNKIFSNNQTYSGSDGSVYGDFINETQQTIDATKNWWGTAADPSSQISGDVTYCPWLATDNLSTPSYAGGCISTPTTPQMLGFNQQGQTSLTEVPPYLACGVAVDGSFKTSATWDDVSGSATNVKYIRHNQRPGGASDIILGQSDRVTLSSSADADDLSVLSTLSDDYDNFYAGWGSFGATEGLYKTRVRAYSDINQNNKFDQGEPISNWSNFCEITYDKTPPSVPTNLQFLEAGSRDVLGCSVDTNQYSIIADWDDVDGAVAYEYQSFNPDNGWIWPGVNSYKTVTASERPGNLTVGEGTYGFRVRAVDAAGNKSDWSSVGFGDSCQITYDVTDPIPPAWGTIYKGHNTNPENEISCGGTTNSTQVTFEWEHHPEESDLKGYWFGTRFNPKHQWFDAGEVVKTANMTAGQDNPYYYTLIAVDKAGNESDPSERCELNLDQVAPDISIDALKYDNGTVEPDKFKTNDNTPLVLGSLLSDDISSVSLNVNGHDYAATLSAGAWEAQVTNALLDGTHTMTVTVTDLAGNSNVFTKDIIIDTKAPTAEHTYYQDGEVITGGIAYGQTLGEFTFTGEYKDQAPSAELYWDSFVIFEAQDDGSFRFSQNGKKSYCGWRNYPNLVDLAGSNFSLVDPVAFTECVSTIEEGEYYLAHHIYDEATRKDIPSINQFRDVLGLHFFIDRTAPDSFITTYGTETEEVTLEATEAANGETYQTPSFSGYVAGTATDHDGSGVDHVLLSISHLDFGAEESARQYWDATASGTGTWTSTPSTFRADGTDPENWNYQLPTEQVTEGFYQVTSHAVDQAGNVEQTFIINLVYDKTIPEVTVTIDPTNPDGANGWYWTEPTLYLAATDNYQLDRIEYQWDSTAGTWTNYTGGITPPGEGQHLLYYRGIDVVGNGDQPTDVGVKVVKYDQTNPVDGPINVRVDSITSDSAMGYWDEPDNNGDITHYELVWSHNQTGDSRGKTVGRDDFEEELTDLFDGEWTFTVKAMDDAGHFKEASTTFRVGPAPAGEGDTQGEVLGTTTGQPGLGGLVAGLFDNTNNNDDQTETEDQQQNSDSEENSGEVLGASDYFCTGWKFYLPFILLALQVVIVAALEFANRKDMRIAFLMALVVTVVTSVAYYLLRDPECFSDDSFLSLVNRWFAIISILLSAFISTVFYAFVPTED